MLTATELAEARAMQTSLMASTLLIERRDGVTEGDYSATTQWTPIYQGPGRLQADSRTKAPLVDLGGQLVRPASYAAAIPWDAPPIAIGDRVTVTASTTAAGSYTIQSVEHGATFVTCRRFTAEEDT
ncbi:DUF6093 family protein [Tessaracoccus palaemonis]|uniref:Uncharacterized protein n=1 Tax=Tessaracoccus palaemonis TaxID=2829499 RepID=A0ABX8SH82_9ACTN|nr:DUF6093 family protein [Tessaracoccus palaemonis]QXT62752.1 hypothetical protein KDB89_13615 [Tessaracoccus palaemonis]